MTKPKPFSFRAKRGRKTKRELARQYAMLRMLAKTDDLTAWQACLCTGCGYDFALKHFRDGRYFFWMAMVRRTKSILNN